MKITSCISVILLGSTAQWALAAGSDEPPKLERLPLQKYIAVRKSVAKGQLSRSIRDGIGQVAAWLAGHGVQPAGPPFVRYLVVNMPEHFDVEIGFPVGDSTKATAPLVAGVFPAGRYVTCTYTGNYDGLEGATGLVLGWAQRNHLALAHAPGKNGDAWKARAEIYLTDPSREKNPHKYQTRILFGLAK